MKSMALRMYACLLFLLLLLFSWMISGDCYFNARTYQAMAWSFPAMALLWMVVYTRFLWRRDYMVPVRGKLQKLSPVVIPFHIAMMGGLFAWMTWLFLYAVLCLAVFATSRTDSRTTVIIGVVHTSGHCPTSYSFFDPSIQRRVHSCGVPYRGAKSGDSVDVVRSVGPVGMHLRSVSPDPKFNAGSAAERVLARQPAG